MKARSEVSTEGTMATSYRNDTSPLTRLGKAEIIVGFSLCITLTILIFNRLISLQPPVMLIPPLILMIGGILLILNIRHGQTLWFTIAVLSYGLALCGSIIWLLIVHPPIH